MKGRRNASPIVSRAYEDDPEACVRALTVLLEKSVHNEAAHPAAPNDARKDKDAGTYSNST